MTFDHINFKAFQKVSDIKVKVLFHCTWLNVRL
jgi:hypothetical protein